MALDMSKYAKLAKEKRKLPIIFMINEKMRQDDEWEGGKFKEVIDNIMENLAHRSVDAVMSVVSFGEEVHLWSDFKAADKYSDQEWPEPKTSGAASFDVALMLVKDMIEDIDTTPEGNYDPIVILISSTEVSPDYEDQFEEFIKDGRFENVQRIGVADLCNFESFYRDNCGEDETDIIEETVPEILKVFAGGNVAAYISDDWNTSWCTDSAWEVTETDADYTWFCPVLSMMELRYTENEQKRAKCVCKNV